MSGEIKPCPIWGKCFHDNGAYGNPRYSPVIYNATVVSIIEDGRNYYHVTSPRAGGQYMIEASLAERRWDEISRITPQKPDALDNKQKTSVSNAVIANVIADGTLKINNDNLSIFAENNHIDPDNAADRLLLWLANKSKTIELGEPINLTPLYISRFVGKDEATKNVNDRHYSSAWSAVVNDENGLRERAITILLSHLKDEGFIKHNVRPESHPSESDYSNFCQNIIVTISGFKHAKKWVESSTGFVAMWFGVKSDGTAKEMRIAYEQGIKPAIELAGYVPIRIDYVDYAGGVVDEIKTRIKNARFVVADFTCGFVEINDAKKSNDKSKTYIPRGGVYLEAGYAEGAGKPVFYTCRDDCFNDTHFDVKHMNMIIWKTPEDLHQQLARRLVNVLGRGAKYDQDKYDKALPIA